MINSNKRPIAMQEHSHRTTTIISTWARAVFHGMRSAGVDLDELLPIVGLSDRQLQDPDARIETAKMTVLWELSREGTDCEDIGLKVASIMQPGNLQSLGFALLTSSNLEEFLKRAIKYFAVVTNVARLEMESDKEGTWLLYEKVPCTVPLADEAVDAAIGTIIVWLRYVIAADYAPERICLQRKRPSCGESYELFFGCPVDFMSDKNAILIHPETFASPFLCANPALSALHVSILDKQIAKVGSANIEHLVRGKIATLLPSGDFSQEKLAALMNMSVSTLHRRLKAEQTNYRKVLDDVRSELATYHLNRTTDSISEIAYHLGFNDVSNFSHACQRWFNTSPRAYRKAVAEL